MSLMTSTPAEPMRANKPPVASRMRSFCGDPESSAPSELIVLMMRAGVFETAQTVSVFAFPLPEISRIHNGSPFRRSAATVARTTSIAAMSY
jgi:hypothetical protein